MTTPPASTKVKNAIKTVITTPISLTSSAINEPVITGALLYVLTRGPVELRERLLQPLRSNILSKNASSRLSTTIKALKYLFALGVLRRFSQGLDRVALNSWNLVPWRKPGNQFIWDGKTEIVVITGGCSGFGYEMVKGFAGKAKIVVLDILEWPAELAKLPEVYYYRCDLTDFDAITSTASAIKNRLGNPSVLINNAGIAGGFDLLDESTAFFEKIMRVNLISHFVLIKEFVPAMLEAKKGHVVAIASMASFASAPGLVDYCVTKSGALVLTEGLRNELLSKYENGNTIQTTTVHPSWHSTGIVRPFEERLISMGIIPDPASNVSKKVVAQVLAAKSGRVFVPENQKARTNIARLPVWIQDFIYGVGPFTSQRSRIFNN